MRAEIVEGEVAIRNPIRGTFPDCCAWAKETVIRKKVASSQEPTFLFIAFLCSFCLISRYLTCQAIKYLVCNHLVSIRRASEVPTPEAQHTPGTFCIREGLLRWELTLMEDRKSKALLFCSLVNQKCYSPLV
jgi:hypothetical protein